MSTSALAARPLAGLVLALAAGWAGSAGATSFAPIHEFRGPDGVGEFSPLTPDGAGGYYGVTEAGGTAGKGTVFHMMPKSAGHTDWSIKTLYSFKGEDDGAGGMTGLALDGAGSLYGMATGGYYGYGTVFRLSPPGPGMAAWSLKTLHSFNAVSTDGCYAPYGSLQIDAQGALYGATQQCGLYFKGTAFRLAPPAPGQTRWQETIIHNFTGGADGTYPLGGVTLVGGRLYGTAYQGGGQGQGDIFQLAPGQGGWVLSVLHTFAGKDGANPMAAPSAGPLSAALYGTTYYGGYGYGVIYSIAPPPSGQGGWQYKVVHSLNGNEGESPETAVAVGSNGTIYGSIRSGGANARGSVFALTPQAGGSSWSFATLHSFAEAGGGGYNPGDVTVAGSLILGGTEVGGTYGDGTLFAIKP